MKFYYLVAINLLFGVDGVYIRGTDISDRVVLAAKLETIDLVGKERACEPTFSTGFASHFNLRGLTRRHLRDVNKIPKCG
jgi:hypothetical protein